MGYVIKDAKTKEAALQAALEELGATEDQVDVEILEKPKEGLFGFLGSKIFKLKVTLPEKEKVESEIEPEEEPSQPDIEIEQDLDDPQPVIDVEHQPPSREYVNTGQDNPEDRVHSFLKEVVEHLGVQCDISVDEGESQIYVDISGKDSGVIIGKFGQTLDSLQYLTNVIMGKKFGNKKKIVIDVGDYRTRREESVRKLARSVAKKVIRNRKNEALSPMSPQDRRTVHLALSNFQDIETSSEGAGINRKVIVSYKQ